MASLNVNAMKTIKIGEDYELVILEDRWNPLINRREIKGIIYHTGKGTPKRWDVRQAVSKALNVPLDTVYVRNLITEFGKSETIAVIHVYKDVERAKKFEPKHIIDRNKPPEKKSEGG